LIGRKVAGGEALLLDFSVVVLGGARRQPTGLSIYTFGA